MPAIAARVALVRASTHSLELCWLATPTATHYLLECQKIEPATQPPQPIALNTPQQLATKVMVQQQQQQQLSSPITDNSTLGDQSKENYN